MVDDLGEFSVVGEDSQASGSKTQVRGLVRSMCQQMGGLILPSTEGEDF